MFSDAALINRRNVGGDVKSRVSASKDFFLLEVESRVVAAVLGELALDSIDGDPQLETFPKELN